MSDGDALLRAILDAPEDDAPRLVYADWLEEHGDADRAAFIRVQVQLARLPGNDPARDRLVQTESTLWRLHRDAWRAEFRGWVKFDRFRRGFLEQIRCRGTNFMSGFADVRAQAPVTAVRLEGPGAMAGPVFRSRSLQWLRSLTFSMGGISPGTWEELAACPYLTELAELDLSSNPHAEELVTSLVRSTTFPALTALRLKWTSLGDRLTPRLVGHPWAGRLRTLDLSNNGITWEVGARAILESPHLEAIEHLNLRGNPLTEHRPTVGALLQRFGGRVSL
jgi:uncharacterized protein (TIGR02996 family)